MKSYTITVNGNVYDVTVEETGSTPSAPVRQLHLQRLQPLLQLQLQQAVKEALR